MVRIFESWKEWSAEGKRRFGEDTSKWEFLCPSCKHVQSVESILNEFPTWKEDEVRKWIMAECIGRHLPIIETKKNGRIERKPIKYCLWAAYGLFKITNTKIRVDGELHSLFDFA